MNARAAAPPVQAQAPARVARSRGVPATAQQHAVESLRAMIVAGELRPGQRVNQDHVAESLGLSRAALYRRIEKYGL